MATITSRAPWSPCIPTKVAQFECMITLSTAILYFGLIVVDNDPGSVPQRHICSCSSLICKKQNKIQILLLLILTIIFKFLLSHLQNYYPVSIS